MCVAISCIEYEEGGGDAHTYEEEDVPELDAHEHAGIESITLHKLFEFSSLFFVVDHANIEVFFLEVWQEVPEWAL